MTHTHTNQTSHRRHIARSLLLFLLVASLTCAGFFFIRQTAIERTRANHAQKEHETVQSSAASVKQSFKTTSGDLLYLAKRHGQLNQRQTDAQQFLSAVAADWLDFSHSHPVYDSIRWFDAMGVERLHIKHAPSQAVILSPPEHPDKIDQHFLTETMKLKVGEIHVSALKLNASNDRIEPAAKPVIRFGTPIFDSAGTLRGIVAIHYPASELLGRFASKSQSGDRLDWLLTHDGDLFKGDTPNEEFGFMHARHELTLARQYPKIWQRIGHEESGQFLTENGLWTFATIRPLQAAQKSDPGSANGGPYAWKMVSRLPMAEYNSGILLFTAIPAVVTAILLLLICTFLWRMTRAQIAQDSLHLELNNNEKLLRSSNQLLSKLTSHLPGVVFKFRIDSNGKQSFPFISEAVKDIYGITPEQVYQDPALIFSFIHPEDFAGVQVSIHESARKVKTWRHEFRAVLPDRSIHWMMGNSRPHKNKDGSIVWYGILADINERKQTEGGVQLATMVYQNSAEAIIVTDSANHIVAVNPAFEKICGYSAEEVIGQNPSILKSDQQNPAFYQALWDELIRSGKWQGELWNRRRDGSLYAAKLAISTTFRDDGSIHYFVGLSSDITQRKEAEKLIWKQANFDALTGLPNRNMFREHIELEFRKSARSGLSTALILLDLDDFKGVNDTLGHNMGDILLQEAAGRLRQCVRDSDVVARLGGDEFTVILGELPDSAIVERVADNILQKISEPYALKGELIRISASIGIAFYPKDGVELETLLRNADQAMYAAKNQGRNRSHYFDLSMQEATSSRMRIVNELRSTVDGKQFVLLYQPIIELATGAIHKAEALIRWQHPERGMIMPGEFIRIAEETGMIFEIGNWVFKEALEQAMLLRASHHPGFQISINVSPMQFNKEPGMVSSFNACLQKTGMHGQAITIEITEGLLLDITPHVSNELVALRNIGMDIAIDDFGTGYSSLSYLKKVDVDYIKIDRSFVANMPAGSEDLALCKAMIAMAHALGMKVIAEGVETDEQRNLLNSIGCDYAQGYLFSQPLTSVELQASLISNAAAMDRGTSSEASVMEKSNVLPFQKW